MAATLKLADPFYLYLKNRNKVYIQNQIRIRKQITCMPREIFRKLRVTFVPNINHIGPLMPQVMPFHGEQLNQYWTMEQCHLTPTLHDLKLKSKYFPLHLVNRELVNTANDEPIK